MFSVILYIKITFNTAQVLTFSKGSFELHIDYRLCLLWLWLWELSAATRAGQSGDSEDCESCLRIF